MLGHGAFRLDELGPVAIAMLLLAGGVMWWGGWRQRSRLAVPLAVLLVGVGAGLLSKPGTGAAAPEPEPTGVVACRPPDTLTPGPRVAFERAPAGFFLASADDHDPPPVGMRGCWRDSAEAEPSLRGRLRPGVPVGWAIAGLPRSTATYGSGGRIVASKGQVESSFDRQVSVQTIRATVDPADVVGHAWDEGEPVTVRGVRAWLHHDEDIAGRTLVVPRGAAVVVLQSRGLSQAALLEVSHQLVDVDDGAWTRLQGGAGADPAAGGVEVTIVDDRDPSSDPGSLILRTLGPLALLGGLIVLLRARRRRAHRS